MSFSGSVQPAQRAQGGRTMDSGLRQSAAMGKRHLRHEANSYLFSGLTRIILNSAKIAGGIVFSFSTAAIEAPVQPSFHRQGSMFGHFQRKAKHAGNRRLNTLHAFADTLARRRPVWMVSFAVDETNLSEGLRAACASTAMLL
ncbi:MAG: hypothetical protein RXS25_31250, partial [Paraburkholderia sp.]|uniref:hypothetical protein n=1 Tax=Paraburkholderia sp. TaxID=1926495 RepID=UPI00397A7FEC